MNGLIAIGGIVFLLFAGNVIDYYRDKARLRRRQGNPRNTRSFAEDYRDRTQGHANVVPLGRSDE